MAVPRSVTELLTDWSNGDHAALEELTPCVYGELLALARSYLRRRRRGHELQESALISEVYLRLMGQPEPIRWESRSHFLGIAARLMRLVLVDYARQHHAAKRGGGAVAMGLEDIMVASPDQYVNVIAVREALRRLAQKDRRKARVVELRYFAGMSREEIATSLDLTVATVKRDLRFGEAWLRRYFLEHCET
jgi:RNA polymerase sigma factor (TIGR02999 family)